MGSSSKPKYRVRTTTLDNPRLFANRSTMATKRKLPMKIGLPTVRQSAKPLGKRAVNDSSSDDAVEDSEAESEGSAAGEDVAMEDAQDIADPSNPNNEDAEEELAEPSFGDRIQALADEPIDVAAAS